MFSNNVITATNISKSFNLYRSPFDRFKRLFKPNNLPADNLFLALKNINLEIRRGETVGIIGKNGSGKSTLLQIICGTLSPTSGTINVHGRIAALLELGAGFNPEFSGRENVYLNAALYGLSRAETDARLADIIAFADIGDFVDQPVKTYSSGMFVRLAFAVVAHVDADILIVDEALAVGDAFFVQKCMRFLRKFKEKGTILFVSHDTGAVVNLCDRAAWLDHGELKMLGPAKYVSEAYLAESQEAVSQHQWNKNIKPTSASIATRKVSTVDQRQQYLNYSKYRNDIEVFEFSPDTTEGHGTGKVVIADVRIENEHRERLSHVVGGETVCLIIQFHAKQYVENLIVGFFLKDRLGQMLFGDNTIISFIDKPMSLQAGGIAEVTFSFQMPILPKGSYSIAAAIGSGTQHDHIPHHWLHDAMILTSMSSSVSTGLVGIPMHGIFWNLVGDNL